MKHLAQFCRTFVAQPSRPASSRSVPASSVRAQCLGARMSPQLAGQDACATRPGTRGCRQYAARGLTPIPPIHSIEGGTFRRHAKDAFHRVPEIRNPFGDAVERILTALHIRNTRRSDPYSYKLLRPAVSIRNDIVPNFHYSVRGAFCRDFGSRIPQCPLADLVIFKSSRLKSNAAP